MIRLEDLTLFVRVAALGSFSRAAREVDLLPGQVSVAIKRLEESLEVRLFARSTRSLRLTAEGEAYLPYARDMLETLQAGSEQIRRTDTELSGTLQIAAPSDLGRNSVMRWLREFRAQHPALNLRLFLSDQVANVFRDPVDVAIRYGHMSDGSYIALPLASENRRVLVASPDYLANHGQPKSPEALKLHNCLCYVLKGRIHDRWTFEVSGTQQEVEVSGSMQCDDADVVRRWALAGEGIVYKSWLDVAEDVRDGRLVALLPHCKGEPTPLHLVCPHRKQFSPAVRQLHTLLKTQCQTLMEELPGPTSTG